MANRGEIMEWVDRGAYDIIQPGCDDAGVTETWHMARMAHTRGKLFCPHNWQDGLVAIANAHVMAAAPNRFLLESNMTPNPLKEGLFKEKLAVRTATSRSPTSRASESNSKKDSRNSTRPCPDPGTFRTRTCPESGKAGCRRPSCQLWVAGIRYFYDCRVGPRRRRGHCALRRSARTPSR